MRRSALLVLTAVALLFVAAQAAAHERSAGAAAALSSYFADSATQSLTGPHARAALQQPLTGTGSNMRIVANVPIDGKGRVAASDIELAGDYAYVGSYGEGMVIIDISNPRDPKRAGVFPCQGGQNDVQLQPGPNPRYAVLAIEDPSNKCHPNNEGFIVIDISDKANPREVVFVGQAPTEGNVEDGAHNTTLDWPWLYVDQYLPTHGEQGKIDIFNVEDLIANPAVRLPAAVLNTPGGGAHDLQVDHRPDGRAIGYAASIGFTDTIDLTNPRAPRLLQRLSAAEHGVGISHGAEPNHDRTLMIETDEYGGGDAVQACGGADSRVSPPAAAQVNVASPGAVHLLRLNQDGTIKTIGPAKVDQIGAYNIPAQNNRPGSPDGCTSHVFWQAPDENRMTIAWYGRGTRVFDFSKPDAPVELGHFIPTGSETWAAKPHKGYIFTGDTVRGMDVLQYTGEGCGRWPTTSGAAEVQRDRYQGENLAGDAPRSTAPGCDKPTNDPIVPLRSSPADRTSSSTTGSRAVRRRVGGYRFVRAARVPATRSGRQVLRLLVTNRFGRKVVAGKRFRVRAGRKVIVRAAVGGPPGRYRYRLVAGRRVVRAGAFRIKTTSRVRVRGATATKFRIGRLRR